MALTRENTVLRSHPNRFYNIRDDVKKRETRVNFVKGSSGKTRVVSLL